MNGLNLNGSAAEQRSYIPPHMRGKMGGPAPAVSGGPPPMNAGAAGLNGSAWGGPPGYVLSKLNFTFDFPSSLL
jgi:ATP-dependent RNA helicase DDX3X